MTGHCVRSSIFVYNLQMLSSKESFRLFLIFGSVDADGFGVCDTYFDAISVLQPTELFELHGQLARRLWQSGNLPQHLSTVGIEADVLVVSMALEPLFLIHTAHVRNY